ncbi:hypothetical protein Tcur_0243 [Thermomonospora curvata DSM 43183]|uniref:Uncharacterized protein n=1 Tax=Thermomonospora curvata (strain ATCC 19995 / DSM 43183 / JCM 3096 / KCTC 9072 / NBRC 15933 / NCIMB 10081 / Henssen B9) TaxID=471852 RepID=D1A1C6_THECD|nr:hypothetical protein Tcur_0243 [Thermomonospora curvata DSM 43183]
MTAGASSRSGAGYGKPEPDGGSIGPDVQFS